MMNDLDDKLLTSIIEICITAYNNHYLVSLFNYSNKFKELSCRTPEWFHCFEPTGFLKLRDKKTDQTS